MAKRKRSRRSWLALCAGTTVGMTALAGCAGSDTDSGPEETEVTGDWPMQWYNAKSQSVVDDWTGPTGTLDIDWSYSIDASSLSKPIIAENKASVTTSRGDLYVFDAATGDVEWDQSEITSGRVPPAVINDTIYTGDDSVVALDAGTGEEKYELEVNGGSVRNFRFTDDLLFFSAGDRVFKTDTDLSDVIWEAEATDTIYDVAVGSDDTIYTKDADGMVMAFDIEADEKLWEDWAPEDNFPSLTLFEDKIYTMDGHYVISLDRTTGDDEIHTELVTASTAPTVSDGILYATDHIEEPLVAIDVSTSEKQSDWNIESGGVPVGRPTVTQNTVYYWRTTQDLHAIDRNTGDILGQYSVDLNEPPFEDSEHHDPSTLSITSNRIYYSDREGKVISIS